MTGLTSYGICVVREVASFAFVVGALAFAAWEAYAKHRGGDRTQLSDTPARRAVRTGPALVGALAGVVAFALGFQLIEPLRG